MNGLPKKTLYLLIVLIAVVGLTVFVLWKGFTEPTSQPAQLEKVKGQVRLDLSLLESEKVKYLSEFPELPELEKELKRDNPFSPYGTSTPTE